MGHDILIFDLEARMIEPRYELMIRDVIAETMDHFMDTVSRCVLNSVPVPDVVLEEKFCQNMMECVEDILKERTQGVPLCITVSSNKTVTGEPPKNPRNWFLRKWRDIIDGTESDPYTGGL